jgi:hypothetical protein
VELTHLQTTERHRAVAVDRKRSDLARLLLDRGVSVKSLRFESVCYQADSELIQLFLDRGADPLDGHPF